MRRADQFRTLLVLLALFLGGNRMMEEFEAFDSATHVYGGEYDRPAKNRHQSRSVVIAKNGMHPSPLERGLRSPP